MVFNSKQQDHKILHDNLQHEMARCTKNGEKLSSIESELLTFQAIITCLNQF